MPRLDTHRPAHRADTFINDGQQFFVKMCTSSGRERQGELKRLREAVVVLSWEPESTGRARSGCVKTFR